MKATPWVARSKEQKELKQDKVKIKYEKEALL